MKKTRKTKIEEYYEIHDTLLQGLEKESCVNISGIPEFENRLLARGFDFLGIYLGEKNERVILAVYANKNFSVYASFFIFPGRAGLFSPELMTQRYDEKILLTSALEPRRMKLSGWIEHNPCEELSASGDISALCSDEFIGVFDRALAAHVKKIMQSHKSGFAPYYATPENYAACRNYLAGLEKIIGGGN
ncbi:MAG TPA: hypothetical protein PKK26_19070 [Candidatus Wallbacteria bacterium]|nr:hypothetical protein [Candidatus Wallbacteria bacterium]